jgi:hypothetical protein
MARSGSTLLGRELDKYKDIGVTIEDNIPDGILSGEKIQLENNDQLLKYLDQLYKDIKFTAWDIEKTKLNKNLKTINFPIKLSDIYRTVYNLYFNNGMPEIVIHKKSQYYLHISRVKKELPDAKFIHLIRDPRAVFNSQMKTRDSQTGKLMSENLVAFALNYRKMMKTIQRMSNVDYFHLVKYEDFIQDQKREENKIIAFLNPSSDETGQNGSYSGKIPGSQKHLHPNIDAPFLERRMHAWRQELKKRDAFVLEKCLKSDLGRYNYPIYKKYNLNLKQLFSAEILIKKFWIKRFFSTQIPGIYHFLKKIFR